MDIIQYNQQAWNDEVKKGNRWTVPFSLEQIEAAKRGELNIVLTPMIPVPLSWFPELKGAQVLALASGGGQQVPALAAAGAHVTVFDLSEQQLKQDVDTAEKFNLKVNAIQGNMMDLSALPSNTYDLIFHPCSNCFVLCATLSSRLA